ncbi:hypothetical protein GLOIN_2v1767518 [Rhizophagus clarus]|uniref:Uncharacterized protein n=1 Tax=Rhizophagus clarus TaxID=94130 RepID=A0A8H3QH93_9GLOM|nr:hypothetical protein GLOIN_2v1767518 [Rhizophagus clarus]
MTCSKVFSGEIPELTSKIMQYLKDDFSTLYSCILVNSFCWCRLAIPLCCCGMIPHQKVGKSYLVIDCYLHNDNLNLNTVELKKLKCYGINLFSSSTLFNYPRFIKCLYLQNFAHSVEKWNQWFQLELGAEIFRHIKLLSKSQIITKISNCC